MVWWLLRRWVYYLVDRPVREEIVSLRSRPLTFAVGVEVEDAAGCHHCLQGDDLVERHAE